MLKSFNMETLAEMDGGRIRIAVEQAIARAVADIYDRPAVVKPRKVNLSIVLKPAIEGDGAGSMPSVEVAFDIGESIPKRQTTTYDMRMTRNGLAFNDLSPEDHQQLDLEQLVSQPQDISATSPAEAPQNERVAVDAG